jgi:hypothetical protein
LHQGTLGRFLFLQGTLNGSREFEYLFQDIIKRALLGFLFGFVVGQNFVEWLLEFRPPELKSL